MMNKLKKMVLRLHEDDDGGQEVSMIMLIIFIALPILIILVVFRKKLQEFIQKRWGDLSKEDQGPGANF